MNIYDHGHWDDDTFIFNEPVELPNGHIMQKLDLSVVQGLEDDGISREDVVHAMLNVYAVEPATEMGDQFSTWHNPASMTVEKAENFYEEDEDPNEVFEAFARGVKGVTAPPSQARTDYEFYLDPEHLRPAGPPVRRSARKPPDEPETSESPQHPEQPAEE